MAELLPTPQAIDASHDESALVALSIAQHGAASLQTVRDASGNRSGYLSLYLIDLTSYSAAATAAFGQFKDGLKSQVDDQAEALRLSLITPGAGQAMEYQEAQAEARAVLALADPSKADPSDYPMLAASIGIDADPLTGKPSTDVAGEARSVDAARKAWLAAGSAIREIRLKGKDAIDATTTQADAQAAFDAIAWPKLSG